MLELDGEEIASQEHMRQLSEALSAIAKMPVTVVIEDVLPTPVPHISAISLLNRARAVYRMRRRRAKFFPSELFGEPAYDLLLDLFIADEERRDISISSATIAASVPPSTALRWITHLLEAGFAIREDDPADGRRSFLRLTPAGRARMVAHLRDR